MSVRRSISAMLRRRTAGTMNTCVTPYPASVSANITAPVIFAIYLLTRPEYQHNKAPTESLPSIPVRQFCDSPTIAPLLMTIGGIIRAGLDMASTISLHGT